MHVTFILQSSYNSGGMERMLTTIANALASGYVVTVLTAFNEGRSDFFPFADKVRRVDLGLTMSGNDYKTVRREYRAALTTWLMAHHQDVVVTLCSMEFFFLPDIKDGSRKIAWFHFAYNWFVETVDRFNSYWLKTVFGNLKRFEWLRVARRYDRFIVLSETDAKSWRRHLDNVSVIYNLVTIKPLAKPDYASHRAISIGRIQRQKGFDFLVDAWKVVHKHCPDWQLDIFGGGSKENIQLLEDQIHHCGLEGVVNLCGYSSNVAAEYARHSLYIMSSRYEGFGLVLVEAGICGLPLISYDCQQGPAEIITPENGILVRPVGDVNALATTICKLADNEELRRDMGQHALGLASRFNLENITEEWRQTLETLATNV